MINELKKYKNIKIIGHKNADFDVMACGYLLEYLFKQLGIESVFVLQDGKVDPYFVETAAKIGFEYNIKTGINSNDKLFLVDHTGNYEQEVIGCFDHHPPVAEIPKNYICKPQTSCAKIIYDWGLDLGLKIPAIYTVLVVYSCYFDSISFLTTKALKEDKMWCEKMIEKYNLNKEEIEEAGYGLTDGNFNDLEFLLNGTKNYCLSGVRFDSSYVVTKCDCPDIAALYDFFRNQIVNKQLFAWCFILSNVKERYTKVFFITREYLLVQKTDRMISRGKDIIPGIKRFLDFKNDGELTDLLIKNNISISTMESCTSGLIASTITDYEGASSILKGSDITYSNEAKIMNGVPSSIINKFGVYSHETARAMAEREKDKYNSDISIGITGTFGNIDPVNKDSVKGEIYFNILNEKENPFKLIYNNVNSRKEIKYRTVDIVLRVLISILKNKN